MSQCKAIFHPGKTATVGYYCIREHGHKGDHQTHDRVDFTEAQARYYKYRVHPRKPKQGNAGYSVQSHPNDNLSNDRS